MIETPGAKRVNAMEEGDRISGLDNDLLHHIMSFLPARDAVRTCVLSPRWSHLWASLPCLNVDANGFSSKNRFLKFVTALLISRGCTPLKSFWLRADGPGIFLENFRRTACLWICHALKSNVEELGIIDHDQNDISVGNEPTVFKLQHCPFTSSHLKKLHLCYVYIDNHFLKKLFSGCPALEDLKMINCEIVGTEFSSATLKNLSIDYVNFPDPDHYDNFHDIVITMPNLVSLHIGSLLCSMPVFVEVQSLKTASVSIGHPQKVTFAEACGILGALSNIKNLELPFPRSVAGVYYLRWDAQLFHVVFSNLTTLYLGDWCFHDRCKALLHLLAHSPNLEKLTLKLMKLGPYDYRCWFHSAAVNTSVPFNCEKLKKIEVICPMGDKAVGMIISILLANIISIPDINIRPY